MNVFNCDSIMLIWLHKCGWYFGLLVDCWVHWEPVQCQKLVALTLLVWHLATWGESLGDSGQIEATGIARRLAARVVLPGDYCQTMALFLSGAWRREGFARRSMLWFRLAMLRQRQAISYRAVWSFGLCFVCLWYGTWTRRCLFVSWAGKFMDGGEHVIIWTGRFILLCSRVRIRVGRFICSVLKLEGCCELGGS